MYLPRANACWFAKAGTPICRGSMKFNFLYVFWFSLVKLFLHLKCFHQIDLILYTKELDCKYHEKFFPRNIKRKRHLFCKLFLFHLTWNRNTQHTHFIFHRFVNKYYSYRWYIFYSYSNFWRPKNKITKRNCKSFCYFNLFPSLSRRLFFWGLDSSFLELWMRPAAYFFFSFFLNTHNLGDRSACLQDWVSYESKTPYIIFLTLFQNVVFRYNKPVGKSLAYHISDVLFQSNLTLSPS